MPRSPDHWTAHFDHLLNDTPQLRTLDNGLTVVYQSIPDHPLISCQLWVRTGSIHEQNSLGAGLSHCLEHMVFKGSSRRGPGQIPAEVQAFGGEINAYTSFDRTVYHIDGPSEHLHQSLDLLADLALNASLPEAELEREREVILREIDMALDDPDRTLARTLFRTAFREHPFRFPVIGLRPLFEQISRQQLADYHARRYQPPHLVLSVAGDFDENELLQSVDQIFAARPATSPAPVQVPPEPEQLAQRSEIHYGPYSLTRGLVAFKIPSLRHPDAPALDILAAIIGAGHSAYLRQRLRERLNLVHSIAAHAWNPGQPGLFLIQYHCDSAKAQRANEAILECCRLFTEQPFSEEELEKARRFALVGEIQSRRTASGLAARLGLLTAMVRDEDYPRQYFEAIRQLTPERLRGLCQQTFQPHLRSEVSLHPENSRPAKNRQNTSRSQLPPFHQSTLPNGARILYQVDRRLPRTFFRFAGRGGPLFEDSAHRGATSLLATLLARDTQHRSATQIADTIESGGGFLQESSGNNSFSLAAEVLPDRAQQALDILQECLLQPAFLESTVAREQQGQIAHLQDLHDDVIDYGRLALRRHFFQQHPFALDPAGNEEGIRNSDPAALRSLYQRLLVGQNAVLVITGDFDPDALLPAAHDFLNQLPHAALRSRDPDAPWPTEPRHETEILPREQAVLFEAFPDCGFAAPEDLLGELLDEILSDMSGPLFHSVREDRSLAYFVGAARMLGPAFGVFTLYAGTRPDAIHEVFDAFHSELERIRMGKLKASELQAARTRLAVHNRSTLQTPAARAARVALNVLHDLPAMDWLDYEERLNKIQLEDLAGFAQRFLSPQQRLRLSVTPEIR